MRQAHPFQRHFLTLFHTGFFPKAPGTAGTIVAELIAVPILYIRGEWVLFFIAILATFLGVLVVDHYERDRIMCHDDSCIVIDEAIGIWLALSLGWAAVNTVKGEVFLFIGGFILFRLLDIYKPGYIGEIDRNWPGGRGVIMDDFLAGVATGITLFISLNMFGC